MLQFKNKLKLEESNYPIDIEYIFTWKKGPLDSTNQTFIIKMIEDGLVHAGVLKADDYRYVRSTISTVQYDNSIKEDFIKIQIRRTKLSPGPRS